MAQMYYLEVPKGAKQDPAVLYAHQLHSLFENTHKELFVLGTLRKDHCEQFQVLLCTRRVPESSDKQ